MLKILFSPSENKLSGGNEDKNELLGSNKTRDEILHRYNNIIKRNSEDEIKNLFGFKKFSECKNYLSDISSLMSAIQRYNGVAYEYLGYKDLTKQAQDFLKCNTIIFSNLYGPILGGDKIANYKVKQGNSIDGIAPERFYKERFSYQLDLFLNDSDILDLRAGYYDKFYKITKPYTSMKFLKNGKSVSHWAKAYRGIVLSEIAKNQINSLEKLKSLNIENLSIKEIRIIKNKTEMIYNIID